MPSWLQTPGGQGLLEEFREPEHSLSREFIFRTWIAEGISSWMQKVFMEREDRLVLPVGAGPPAGGTAVPPHLGHHRRDPRAVREVGTQCLVARQGGSPWDLKLGSLEPVGAEPAPAHLPPPPVLRSSAGTTPHPMQGSPPSALGSPNPAPCLQPVHTPCSICSLCPLAPEAWGWPFASHRKLCPP